MGRWQQVPGSAAQSREAREPRPSHGEPAVLADLQKGPWLLSDVSVPLLQSAGLDRPAARDSDKGRLARGRAGLSPGGRSPGRRWNGSSWTTSGRSRSQRAIFPTQGTRRQVGAVRDRRRDSDLRSVLCHTGDLGQAEISPAPS